MNYLTPSATSAHPTCWAYSPVGKVIVSRNSEEIAEAIGYLYEVVGFYLGERIPRYEMFKTNALIQIPGVGNSTTLLISGSPVPLVSNEQLAEIKIQPGLSPDVFAQICESVERAALAGGAA